MKSHMLIISYEFSLYYTSIKYGLSDSRADQSVKKKKGGKEHSYTKRVINSLNQMGIIFSLFFPKCLTGYIFLT